MQTYNTSPAQLPTSLTASSTIRIMATSMMNTHNSCDKAIYSRIVVITTCYNRQTLIPLLFNFQPLMTNSASFPESRADLNRYKVISISYKSHWTETKVPRIHCLLSIHCSKKKRQCSAGNCGI